MEDLPTFDEVTPRGNFGPNKDNCIPLFSLRPVENKAESNKHGRPIFHDVEWVKIYIPGDKTTVVSKKVTDEHRERWPEQYSAFKRGREQPIVGTPLEQWPQMTRSKVAEFKALAIHTVESLAGLDDAAVNRLGMGTRDLRERARAYLQAAQAGKKDSQLAALLEAMQVQIDELAQRLEEVTGEQVPRETSATPVIPEVVEPELDYPTPVAVRTKRNTKKKAKKKKAAKAKRTVTEAAQA